MGELKTKATGVSVDAFIDSVENPKRREDARVVRRLMERLSGEPATMWGPSIVGFGRYHYKYDSGHEGEMCRLGFSPRTKELVLYLLGDIPGQQELLGRLGKHRTGKSCLYIKSLDDVEQTVFEELVGESLAYMDLKYPR